MDAQDIHNLQEAYLEVYQKLDEVIGDEYYLIENVSTGKSKRASFGGIAQRTTNSEVEKIKSSARASKINKLSKENRKGGISRNSGELRGGESPNNAATKKRSKLKPVMPHMRKTPEQKEIGRRDSNIRGALSDPHWGTRAANYDWRQERRSARSERLGLNKEEYDCLINYILDERYANSYDEAEYILENILEEDFDKIVEEFKDLTPEKEERVKKRVEDLTGKMQHHTDQAKRNAEEFTKRKEGEGLLARIKQIVVGNHGPRSRGLKHVAKARKYAKHIKNAQDALSRSSAGRSASLIHKRNQVRQQLQNLGVNPDAGPDSNNIRRFKREEVDLYDIILSHLLDEGYADTEEAATTIVENMSEKWISTILEAHPLDAERMLMKTGKPYRQPQYLKPTRKPKRSL